MHLHSPLNLGEQLLSGPLFLLQQGLQLVQLALHLVHGLVGVLNARQWRFKELEASVGWLEASRHPLGHAAGRGNSSICIATGITLRRAMPLSRRPCATWSSVPWTSTSEA
jgi:hypothetical protein